MSSNLIQQLQSVRSMSIVGMCKNAGKTTMLNWLLAHSGRGRVLGLTSIGRDGESTDVVTGTEKPSIFVPAGTLIATAKDMLWLGDVTKEILVSTGIPTPLGEVIIMRARSDGYVQLAGPSITTQLKSVSQTFFDLGAGAVDHRRRARAPSPSARGRWRRASSSAPGASYHMRMEKVIADTVSIYRIMNLPKAQTVPTAPEGTLEQCLKEQGEALVTGALTDSMVLPLLRAGVLRKNRLVVADPSKVLLSPDTLDKMQLREVRLETAEAARTLCITVNPVSAYGWKFDKDEFRARLQEAVDVPVINVKEELT